MKAISRLSFWSFVVAVATVFPLSALAADKHSQAEHWSYAGKTAPEYWATLSAEYSLCSSGKHQSPVDLGPSLKSPAAVTFQYKPSPLAVVNNGHTIQVNYAPGSYAFLDGKRYELAQFHFHGPSEHTVRGKQAPMEVHLVHRDAVGKLAVVGVFLNKGQEHPALQSIWINMPATPGEKNAEGVFIDAASLLPADREVYAYSGSLTTPPCSEDVSWFVMTTPIQVSTKQVKEFKRIVHANARPVQPLNGEQVAIGPQ